MMILLHKSMFSIRGKDQNRPQKKPTPQAVSDRPQLSRISTIWKNAVLATLILGLSSGTEAMHQTKRLSGDADGRSPNPPTTRRVDSDFLRRLEISNGLVVSPERSSVGKGPRCWIPNNIIILSGNNPEATTIVFEWSSRLQEIGNEAFKGSDLESIFIPESVEFLREESFSECRSLSSLRFESGSQLSRIERGAFSGTGLVEITLPASVEVIEEDSFFDCQSLSSLTFEPNSRLSRIERSAFFGTGLVETILPTNVEFLGEESFAECHSLTSLRFESGSRLAIIENSAFQESALTEIDLPASVKVIGEKAFSGCRSLSSVTFEECPLHLEIGKDAFTGTSVVIASISQRPAVVPQRTSD